MPKTPTSPRKQATTNPITPPKHTTTATLDLPPGPSTFPLNPQTPHALPNPHSEADVDPDTDYTSPHHFSPSKARAHARATQKLTQLTRWLSTVGVETPLINRWTQEHHQHQQQHAVTSQSQSQTDPGGKGSLTAEMVAWLEETMLVNRRVDEGRMVVFEARREQVEAMRVQEHDEHERAELRDRTAAAAAVAVDDIGTGTMTLKPSTSLLDEISSHLTDVGVEALNSLAETAIRLGHVPSVHGTGSLGREMGQAVIEYTVQTQEMQGRLEALQGLQQTLAKQLVQVQAQLVAFESEKSVAAKEAEVMHPQTAQWNRETKQIALKIQEYRDRVATLERSRPGSERGSGVASDFVSVEDVIEIQERVKEKRSNVSRLEKRVQMLHGLPPDLEASRDEVKRAKAELERLKARREELFGTLAERS